MSEPAPGSENSWHHSVSARSSPGRSARFCSSVPNMRIVGAHMPRPIMNSDAGDSKPSASSLNTRWCSIVSPWPPYSSGKVIPASPASARACW